MSCGLVAGIWLLLSCLLDLFWLVLFCIMLLYMFDVLLGAGLVC